MQCHSAAPRALDRGDVPAVARAQQRRSDDRERALDWVQDPDRRGRRSRSRTLTRKISRIATMATSSAPRHGRPGAYVATSRLRRQYPGRLRAAATAITSTWSASTRYTTLCGKRFST